MAGPPGADLAVGRVRGEAAGIADGRAMTPGAPRSPSRRPRSSRGRRPRSRVPSGHGPASGRAEDAVGAGLDDGVGTAGEGPVRVRHLCRPEVVENAHVEIRPTPCDRSVTTAARTAPLGEQPAERVSLNLWSGRQALPVEAGSRIPMGRWCKSPLSGSIRYAEESRAVLRHHQDLRRVGRPQPRVEVRHRGPDRRGPGGDHRPGAIGGGDPNPGSACLRRRTSRTPTGRPGDTLGTPLQAVRFPPRRGAHLSPSAFMTQSWQHPSDMLARGRDVALVEELCSRRASRPYCRRADPCRAAHSASGARGCPSRRRSSRTRRTCH